MKLFRDYRSGTTPRCPLSGCLWSVVCRVRSVRLVTALMMYDGAIPASTGKRLLSVGFREHVLIMQVSFSVALQGDLITSHSANIYVTMTYYSP